MPTRFHPRGGNIASRTAQAVPSVTNTARSLLVQSCCSNAKPPLVQNCWSDTKPPFCRSDVKPLLMQRGRVPKVGVGPAEENGRPSPRIVYRDITDTTKSDGCPLYPSILPASSAATGIQRTRDSFLDRHLASSLHKTPLMPGDHAQWSQWQWRRPWRYAQRLRAMAAMRVRATITRNGGDDTCSDYA